MYNGSQEKLRSVDALYLILCSAEELFQILLGRLDNEDEKARVEDFFGASGALPDTAAAAQAAYRNGLATVEANIQHMNRIGRGAIAFLQEEGFEATVTDAPEPTTASEFSYLSLYWREIFLFLCLSPSL